MKWYIACVLPQFGMFAAVTLDLRRLAQKTRVENQIRLDVVRPPYHTSFPCLFASGGGSSACFKLDESFKEAKWT